jgi:acetylornithine deacetylase/succinyl-diaminopimelate desuccinylase-like protein
MSSTVEELREIYANNQKKFLEDYFRFLSFQSVSTDPAFTPDVLACAEWLTDYIQSIGFTVEKWPTSGYPVIFAQNLEAGPDQPTLLIYNHYDVQPVDPVNEWSTPPFQPSIRNGEVYARGAEDNKGQCMYVLHALKVLKERKGRFPINIKLCIEGEEESGSRGLAETLTDPSRQEKLKADYLAIVDMGLRDKDTPAVTLGVRGITALEISVQGSKTDLHSGSHGGIVYNPLRALVQMLSRLWKENGEVAVPGFYDDVVELSPQEKDLVALDFDSEKYQAMFGALPTGGERAFSALERAWIRPTIEINGIGGGYSGPGMKTVIPAKASVKISCRLVPNQDPDVIGPLVAQFLKEQAPEGIQVVVPFSRGGGKAVRANPNSPVVKAFAQAYEELFHKPCERIFEGGSIPIATQLTEVCGGDVILLGFGLPDDQIHAPNEHFGIDRLEKGFIVMTRALELLEN